MRVRGRRVVWAAEKNPSCNKEKGLEAEDDLFSTSQRIQKFLRKEELEFFFKDDMRRELSKRSRTLI